MRKPIVAGNWKMNKTVTEAVDLVTEMVPPLSGVTGVDVVVCPPFTALQAVGQALTDTSIVLGAQNMHWEPSGAFTGEVAPIMLRDLYCHYVILGHSERRQFFGETDATVNRKVKAALDGGLRPIVCVGELLEERDGGRTAAVVESQVRGSLAGLPADAWGDIVIAYEPVWAIGTGRTATPAQAQEVHALIRSVIASLADDSVAHAIRIQYGGSMKPANAKELMAEPDIDGGLIGGAALEASSFVEIVKAAQQ